MIYAALGSVVLITLFFRYVWNRFSPFEVCPICAGGSGTWILMLVANKVYSLYIDPVLIGIFVGGTIVGIMYEIAGKMPEGRSRLLFKTLFLIAGFFTAYMLVSWNLALSAAGAVIMAAIGYMFLRKERVASAEKKSVEELKEKMKQCC